MYDNVDFVLNQYDINRTDLLAEIPNYLSNCSEHTFSNGMNSISGYLDTLKVYVSNTNVKIKNSSLCKYYLGDNFQTLQRSDTKRAIQKISDGLHLDFHNATVTRIDIAQNLMMKYPEITYINQLGILKYFHKSEMPDGLYFSDSRNPKNIKNQLVFYKKVTEQKAKGKPIPELYDNRNVLRYEMRFKKRLKQIFNKPEILASSLYDENFYIDVLDKWKQNYFDITKIQMLNFNKDIMKNIKQFRQFNYYIGIKDNFKSLDEALRFIETLDNMNYFDSRTQKQRLKDEVKKAFSMPEITKSNELIDELDKKVKQAIKFYR